MLFELSNETNRKHMFTINIFCILENLEVPSLKHKCCIQVNKSNIEYNNGIYPPEIVYSIKLSGIYLFFILSFNLNSIFFNFFKFVLLHIKLFILLIRYT